MALKDTLRIMVVDDTSTSRFLIEQALTEIGIAHVSSAADGETAFKALNTSPVHLVISDYHMPKIDGLQLLKALRQHKPTSKVGFVLVTGRADEKLIAEGRRLGMNNYLAKPFTTDAMRKCLEALVGRL